MSVVNMLVKPQRTLAETALIDAFGERLSQMPGNGAVSIKRDDAIEMVKAGLPTRRVEFWHYTDLRRLLTSVPSHDPSARASQIAPVIEGSTVLAVLNGIASDKAGKAEGVSVVRVEDKLADGTLAPSLGLRDDDDAVGAINTAFAADG